MKGMKVTTSRLQLDESNPSPITKEEFTRNIPFEQRDNGEDISAIFPIGKTNNEFT